MAVTNEVMARCQRAVLEGLGELRLLVDRHPGDGILGNHIFLDDDFLSSARHELAELEIAARESQEKDRVAAGDDY